MDRDGAATLYVFRANLAIGHSGPQPSGGMTVEVGNMRTSASSFMWTRTARRWSIRSRAFTGGHQPESLQNGDLGPGFLVWSEGDPPALRLCGHRQHHRLHRGHVQSLRQCHKRGIPVLGCGRRNSAPAVNDAPWLDCPTRCGTVSRPIIAWGSQATDTVAHEWAHAYTQPRTDSSTRPQTWSTQRVILPTSSARSWTCSTAARHGRPCSHCAPSGCVQRTAARLHLCA